MIPRYVQTLFQLLSQSPGEMNLPEAEWRELLGFADRTQLTLHLRALLLRGRVGVPPWLEVEIESRRARNLERRRRLGEAFAGLEGAFKAHSVDFVLLKGFTHEKGFGIDPEARVQYDLDLLCAPEDLVRAGEALRSLGYAPHSGRSLNDEHSQPWVRPTDWTWRGDYFDPEIPISVELHDTLWDSGRDRIHIDTAAFWNRRSDNALAELDRAGFAALHVLRHVLRLDARPAHTYELARLLQTQDDGFWQSWAEQHDPRLGALEAVSFRFASEWFGFRLPDAVENEWLKQPDAVKGWFRDFVWSPIGNLVGANKDAVWLHLALVENWSDRVRVFCHRLTPFRRPHAGLFNRLRYHAGAFAPALLNGLRWWRRHRAASTASQISPWNRESV